MRITPGIASELELPQQQLVQEYRIPQSRPLADGVVRHFCPISEPQEAS